MTIYRYGAIAWFWRFLALVGIGGAVVLVLLAFGPGGRLLLAGALPLAVPSVFLPWVLAVQIDMVGEDEILVHNLWFAKRRIRRSALGRPRVKRTAQGTLLHIHAPRAWIPVAGGWPIYVDLLADIPDFTALRAVLNLPKNALA